MLKINGKDLDVRVSVVPTLFGERLVCRVLERAVLLRVVGQQLSLERIEHHGEIRGEGHEIGLWSAFPRCGDYRALGLSEAAVLASIDCMIGSGSDVSAIAG